MKKLFVCKSLLLFLAVSLQIMSVKTSSAETVVKNTDVSKYIANIYGQFDFKGSEKLSYDVFEKAYKGYLNLRNAGKLSKSKEILTVVDFAQSSTKKRMWVLDLKTKKVLINDYVAHGQGSGSEYATVFSNTQDSHQSSIGFYVTGEIYTGEHGASLRLHGMDNGYNSAAYDRAIVIHGADYVWTDMIQSQHRLGRSWGCPAVSNQVVKKLINVVHSGTCLFIYAPQKNYLAKAYWLNKKLEFLPEEKMLQDMMAMNTEKKRDTVFVYDESAADLAPQGAKILAANTMNAQPTMPYFPLIWKVLP